MKKTNRWSIAIIFAVSLSVFSQILPTIIYYSQDLSRPLNQQEITQDLAQMNQRVKTGQLEHINWIKSYAKSLHIPIKTLAYKDSQSNLIDCQLKSSEQAQLLSTLIPIASAKRLSPLTTLSAQIDSRDPSKLIISTPNLYSFPSSKQASTFCKKENNELTVDYKNIIDQELNSISNQLNADPSLLPSLAQLSYRPVQQWNIHEVQRFYKELLDWKQLSTISPNIYQKLSANINSLLNTNHSSTELLNKIAQFEKTLKEDDERDTDLFSKGKRILSTLSQQKSNELTSVHSFCHPLITQVHIDQQSSKIILEVDPAIQLIIHEKENPLRSILQHKIFTLVSHLNKQLNKSFVFRETISSPLLPGQAKEQILSLNLDEIYEQELQVLNEILNHWAPKHIDLQKENYPLIDSHELSSENSPQAIITFSPLSPSSSMDPGAVYLVFNKFDELTETIAQKKSATESETFSADMRQLYEKLSRRSYLLCSDIVSPHLEGALVFKLDNPVAHLLPTTRRPWQLSSDQRRAFIAYESKGQHLALLNKIDNKIHEEHLKEDEAYDRSQVEMNENQRALTAPYFGNLYWDNICLSIKKILRGDSEKVLKWGMDLSGGKTVRLALLDQNKQIKDPLSLQQAQSELSNRINGMGLAEVAIRIEGEYLVVDFPSSQTMSADELIVASKMSFHIVNEVFTPQNIELQSDVIDFLQHVWTEAQLEGKQDLVTLNAIASRLLGTNGSAPKLESAQRLQTEGLQILPLDSQRAQGDLNENLSMIVPVSDDNRAGLPLMIVFRNYALEGNNLSAVRWGHDQTHGYILSFSISNQDKKDPSSNPQEVFHAWTKRYCAESIQGTDLESITHSRGWRMAVVLNEKVISSPALSVALSDGAMIHGNFTQRQAQQLSTDLQAGSLSFTPKILSEENISPDLGLVDRNQGIIAAFLALVFVVATMSFYYRFAGVIASIAVLFNLLVTWAVLQNLGAALTLSGIAGIVLTVGMSVDANVLIFERIREELALGKKLSLAISTGYQRAFSAILDSNITTMLAAFILIQFDSGPIKGFAMTLLIGIGASMFTALFMTRTFFQWWTDRNPKEKTLRFHQWINQPNFNFFRFKKSLLVISAIFTISGLIVGFNHRHTLLGMDFSGGYGLHLHIEASDSKNLRSAISSRLIQNGMSPTDFEIRQVDQSNKIKLQINGSVDEDKGIFSSYSDDSDSMKKRVHWIYQTLNHSGLKVLDTPQTLLNNWTSISGQFSKTMRNHALLAIAIALIGILIYITLRFEWKYALSSVLGLAFDILITLSAYCWLKYFEFPVQIDLQAVGAIMTIIGYALNDTIIIFDRIREDGMTHSHNRQSHINSALNRTLSRTLMTSGTTLVALLSLSTLGGVNLFSFSILMTMGVIFGTFSSLFITSFILLYIYKKSSSSYQG